MKQVQKMLLVRTLSSINLKSGILLHFSAMYALNTCTCGTCVRYVPRNEQTNACHSFSHTQRLYGENCLSCV